MRAFIDRIIIRGTLWLLRTSEIAQFDGIHIADFKRHSDSETFRVIILAALQLLKDTDSRRFNQVRKHLSWVVNRTLQTAGAAQYERHIQACTIDFLSPSAEYDSEFLIGWYASVLVHESTHGRIASRGIRYTPELRARIERLCVAEQHRFELHLTITHPDLAERLYREFDPSDWHEFWNSTPTQRFLREIRRLHQRNARTPFAGGGDSNSRMDSPAA